MALADADVEWFTLDAYSRRVARTTVEVLTLLSKERPSAVVVDIDVPAFDGLAICQAAHASDATAVLVTMSAPDTVPALLKAGCHGILLKPFPPNLFAARIGRLVRERSQQLRLRSLRPLSGQGPSGTNRTWPAITCPRCHEPNAVGFEFSSYRRVWFACLACDQVWLGRQPD
jgi:DNA-binding response OmpR family regulator